MVGQPDHYTNLVERAFTKIGFGIVRPDARIFAVQVFMLPSGSAGATPAASPTTPEAAPVAARAAVPTTSPPPPATTALPARRSPGSPGSPRGWRWSTVSTGSVRDSALATR